MILRCQPGVCDTRDDAQLSIGQQKTSLSKEDVMRQSMKLGLPTLVDRLSQGQSLKRFTKAEWKRCYSQTEDEFDVLAQHCASLAPRAPEE